MVVLGRIVAPYGIRGWVKIRPFGDDPASWGRMPQWWLGRDPAGAEWQPYGLREFRAHGGSWVARLDGVEDRTGAEALEGRFVAAPREALPATAEDEYYWADLIGLEVVNERDESLGRVESLIETGANQVLVVRDGGEGGERLLPFVGDVVLGVNRAAGRIRVRWERDW